MIKFKRLFLVSASALAFVTTAIASDAKVNKPTVKPAVVSDLEVKLNGFAHFQAAYVTQSKLEGDEKNLSSHKKDVAFFNETAVSADISTKVNDLKCGGKIVLVPTSSRKGGVSFNGSHIYVESDFGKIAAGSPISPATSMSIADGELDAAAGPWDRYASSDIAYLKGDSNIEPSFAASSEFFLDSKLATKLDNRVYSKEPARSIVYYTPKFDLGTSTKVQLGISYIPDSSNTGADRHNKNSSGTDKRIVSYVPGNAPGTYALDFAGNKVVNEMFTIDSTVKDAFAGGLVIEQNFADGVDLKFALTGEYGKSAGMATKSVLQANNLDSSVLPRVTTKYKLSDLKTFNVGAVLNVGNFSYTAAYGTLGKSLTTPEFHKTGRETHYYSGGMAYKQGPFATSVSYFKSEQFKNIAQSISIGANYQLAPGFKPYVGVSYFSLKGRPEYYVGDKPADKKKVCGTVAVIGAKLSL